MSIKLNNRVVNAELFDSEEEDYSDQEIEEEVVDEVDDEDTLQLADTLSSLLEEVAKVYAVGRKKLRVNFFDHKEIEFVSKRTKCDFDIGEDLYPIMPDGGENYFVCYMEKLKEIDPDFEKTTIETNVDNFKFKI